MNLNTRERVAMVRDFHVKFGHPVAAEPEVPTPRDAILRVRMLFEEMMELVDALGVDIRVTDGEDDEGISLSQWHLQFNTIAEVNMVEVVDALRDLEYIMYGTEILLGIYEAADDTFAEVHRSNMEKSTEKDEFGKTIKPADWTPPDIAGILRRMYPKRAIIFR